MRKLTAFAGLMALAFASSAFAGTITQTFTVPTQTVDVDPTFNVTFNQFNPSVGILNSITLSFTGTETTSNYVVTNSNSSTKTGSISVNYDLVLSGPGGVGLEDSQNIPGGQSYNLAANSSSSPAVYSHGVSSSGGFGPDDYDFSGFTGTNTLVLALSDGTSLSGVKSGISVSYSGALTNGLVTLVYNYTTVIPEPTTVAFGLGLAALAAAGVYRRKQREVAA